MYVWDSQAMSCLIRERRGEDAPSQILGKEAERVQAHLISVSPIEVTSQESVRQWWCVATVMRSWILETFDRIAIREEKIS